MLELKTTLVAVKANPSAIPYVAATYGGLHENLQMHHSRTNAHTGGAPVEAIIITDRIRTAGHVFQMHGLHHALRAFHRALPVHGRLTCTRCRRVVKAKKLALDTGQQKLLRTILALPATIARACSLHRSSRQGETKRNRNTRCIRMQKHTHRK